MLLKIILIVIMLSVIMLNVVMLNVIMLNVVAPFEPIVVLVKCLSVKWFLAKRHGI